MDREGPVEEFTAPAPLRAKDDVINHYTALFNRNDEELYPQDITDDMAADWLNHEVPFFECADRLIERVYWFRGSGDELSYSSWMVDAVTRYAVTRGDREFAIGLLDDFVRFYHTVEERNMTRYGLFWSYDDRDAMGSSPRRTSTTSTRCATCARRLATSRGRSASPMRDTRMHGGS